MQAYDLEKSYFSVRLLSGEKHCKEKVWVNWEGII